jgi:WD40 repeat protein
MNVISIYRCFQKHEGAVQSISFSPDSNWLITSCTLGVLKLFSTAELIDTCTSNRREVTELVSIDDAHDMGVVCCDFSIFQEVSCTYTNIVNIMKTLILTKRKLYIFIYVSRFAHMDNSYQF